jgi:succinyl-diaminopimelate desuccinylase
MISDDRINSVLKQIDRDELIDLTTRLVRVNSVWDPAEETSELLAAEIVQQWAKAEGFDVIWDTVAPKRPNVIVKWPFGPGNRTLMFEGHTDVVTPGDISIWKHDPFGAEIIGKRMYGRGTNDTKGNLAAMLVAIKALKRSKVKLDGTIIGGVLCDEEDQMRGVRDFIRQGHADRVTGAIICEPQDGFICTTQKGALRARYRLTGRMSHGAMPLTGLNVAPALSLLIDRLHRLELNAIHEFGQDEHLGWPSFTPTVIQAPASGPSQLNVMPGEGCLLVDIRTIPGQSHDKVKADLSQLAVEIEQKVRTQYIQFDQMIGLDRDPDLNVELNILTDRPCTLTDIEDPVVRAAAWATEKVTGSAPVYAGVPGATDGTFLWAVKNIPIVTMGAGNRQIPHQVDEWVDLDQLFETAKIYAMAALFYLMPQKQI